ncbi:hypothetical protein Tco_0823474 [Tanacetum coccineum]|uniref:Uncharacterized protein n=1 Tax=Tanacetum coccineum TaxID=301880 RepID=A0ABQ5AI05_9ASTR
MNRSLFTRIVRDLSANCPYFQEGCDAVGKGGISALVKCTSAIRQLAYAAVPDSLDENGLSREEAELALAWRCPLRSQLRLASIHRPSMQHSKAPPSTTSICTM